MLTHGIRTLYRMALVAVLGLALAATGFAHRLPDLETEASARALTVALAGGLTEADLCGEKGQLHRDALCPACQIAGSADLPPLQGVASDLDLTARVASLTHYDDLAVPQPHDPANRPQGPPVA